MRGRRVAWYVFSIVVFLNFVLPYLTKPSHIIRVADAKENIVKFMQVLLRKSELLAQDMTSTRSTLGLWARYRERCICGLRVNHGIRTKQNFQGLWIHFARHFNSNWNQWRMRWGIIDRCWQFVLYSLVIREEGTIMLVILYLGKKVGNRGCFLLREDCFWWWMEEARKRGKDFRKRFCGVKTCGEIAVIHRFRGEGATKIFCQDCATINHRHLTCSQPPSRWVEPSPRESSRTCQLKPRRKSRRLQP